MCRLRPARRRQERSRRATSRHCAHRSRAPGRSLTRCADKQGSVLRTARRQRNAKMTHSNTHAQGLGSAYRFADQCKTTCAYVLGVSQSAPHVRTPPSTPPPTLPDPSTSGSPEPSKSQVLVYDTPGSPYQPSNRHQKKSRRVRPQTNLMQQRPSADFVAPVGAYEPCQFHSSHAL